jgi:hypothetical protein
MPLSGKAFSKLAIFMHALRPLSPLLSFPCPVPYPEIAIAYVITAILILLLIPNILVHHFETSLLLRYTSYFLLFSYLLLASSVWRRRRGLGRRRRRGRGGLVWVGPSPGGTYFPQFRQV